MKVAARAVATQQPALVLADDNMYTSDTQQIGKNMMTL